jgi:hypothetical protein
MRLDLPYRTDISFKQMVIQIVSAELQSNTARRASPNDQLTLLVTALLALNLAAITGVRKLYATSDNLCSDIVAAKFPTDGSS